MNTAADHARPRPMRIGLIALLMIPLLLVLHAPVLAAVIPTALIAAATVEASTPRPALPAAQVIDAHDLVEVQRVAAAEPIAATTRRIG